jgi:carbonic anhydrase/acetyltransferase-like protein (isoleucine patch superfamily)
MIIEFGGIRPRIHPSAFIAPTAVVIGNVEIGAESSIWYGAVLRGDDPDRVIRVGSRTSIQDNCVVHVSAQGPTLIGDEVTVGHGAVLESCAVGRGSLIGMNAVVLQRVEVGEHAVIAAGAVVPIGMVVPPRTLVAGVPAVVKKEISGESRRATGESAGHYVELSRQYLGEGLDGAAAEDRNR